MEGVTPPSSLSLKHAQARKPSLTGQSKDIWVIVREGSLPEVDSALALLKKSGGNIDCRNAFGLTPLHIATWRNHMPIVRRLLAAGADPNARDGESGWSSLHRACHFGHLSVAGTLLNSGASLTLEDSKGRTPIDLLYGPLSLVTRDSVTTEVFSWGSGTNYQLGTGNAHIQKLPCKIDALLGSSIKVMSASKFHSAAVSSSGELYTWGFGRGGRLGQPDFDVHSGQAAIITPRQVIAGIGTRRVKVVAAAKHHTISATDTGDVFTWGSNREGQLGYTSVDTQPIPRRVTSLRAKIISVAAANKHSAAVSDSGEVFTWGCNKEGQLGYGTSNSGSNYTPRIVDYMKGKVMKAVSAAKYHTIVLGADGEVFTWGHRLVTPRRVVVSRSLKKIGSSPLHFHRKERLHVTSIAAGVTHSIALSDDGALFYWVSSDADLRCRQIYALSGKNFASISAGKYWIAGVTLTGDVYFCDAKKSKEQTPIMTRLHGVKRATSVCVGETHMLILSSLYHPTFLRKPQNSGLESNEQLNDCSELSEELLLDDVWSDLEGCNISAQSTESCSRSVPSLKSLCEKVAIESLLEPKNAMDLLEVADSLEADDLRKHCEDVAVRNLDYILTVAASSFMNASSGILAKLEVLLDSKSSESWSHRRLPTITATCPAIIASDNDEDSDKRSHRPRENHTTFLGVQSTLKNDGFLQADNVAEQAVSKHVRALKKKLQQIEVLEAKHNKGQQLDDQQLEKLGSRSAIESELAELGFPVEPENMLSSSLLDGRMIRKTELSKKQRKRNKQRVGGIDSFPSQSEQHGLPVLITTEQEREVKLELEVLKLNNPEALGEVEAIDRGKLVEVKDISGNMKSKESCRPSGLKDVRLAHSKKNRKGGLSLFLNGALDDAPKCSPSPVKPVTPKSEGPAWGGGVKVEKALASLREIQHEQSKTKGMYIANPKENSGHDAGAEAGGCIPLASFIPNTRSSPIAVAPSRALPVSDTERSTPPWSSATGSPNILRPSLRDIQMQQEKRHRNVSHSPKTMTSGFAIPSTVPQAEVLGTRETVPSRWFKPETEAASSIRSIQIEELAIKDLKRFYRNVRLVKPQVQ